MKKYFDFINESIKYVYNSGNIVIYKYPSNLGGYDIEVGEVKDDNYNYNRVMLKLIKSPGGYESILIKKSILNNIIIKKFKNMEEYNKYTKKKSEEYQHIDPYGEDDWEN